MDQDQGMVIDGRFTHVPAQIAQKLRELDEMRNEFCRKRGWNPNNLTTSQMQEIHKQPAWLAIETRK